MFHSIYLVDLENNKLYMEQVIGKTLKDILWTHAKGDTTVCVSLLSNVPLSNY